MKRQMVDNEVIDYEINLKEMIKTIWRYKNQVVLITALSIAVSIVQCFFFQEQEFNSKITIGIMPPEVVKTQFGDYKFQQMSKEDYISMVKSPEVIAATIKTLDLPFKVENLKSRIKITSEKNENIITLHVIDQQKDRANQIAKELANQYIGFIIKKEETNALNHFMFQTSTELSLAKSKLQMQKKTMEGIASLLKTIPSELVQRKSLSNDTLASVYAASGIDLSDAMYEHIPNLSYYEVEKALNQIKIETLANESEIDSYARKMDALNERNAAIYAEKATRENNAQQSIVGAFASVIIDAYAEDYNSRLVFKILVGAILGLMLGILSAFLREYINNWHK